jgi:tetratricopeptide (TPR) repeat protein
MRNRRCSGDRFSYLPALCAIGYASLALAGEPGEPPLLQPDRTIARELTGKESHEYRFALQKGEYAQVEVEQRSVNVRVACFGPDGDSLYDADTFLAGEPETVALIGNVSGRYRFVVTGSDATAPVGTYAITLRPVEQATDRHRSRVAGLRAYADAYKISSGNANERLRQMISVLEGALAHWRAAQDFFEEARTLYSLGSLFAALGDQKNATEYTTRSLPVARASGNPRSEAWALHSLAELQNYYADKRKAIEYDEQALPLMRRAGDRSGEGIVLNGLGTAYARTGEKRKALAYFEQAEQVVRCLQERSRLASLAGNIGVTLSDLGEYQAALKSHQRALALQRETGNRAGQAVTLNNIGTVYSSLAEYQKALDAHTEAVEINGHWTAAGIWRLP